MKINNLQGWLSLMLLIIVCNGCEKAETTGYIGRPGVYFNGNAFSYSFTEKPGTLVDTVLLPVLVSGRVEDYDRTIRAVAVPDSTTATDDMFRLLDGTVKAGEETGLLPFEVRYVSELDDTTVVVKVQLVENDDFQELDLAFPSCKVSFTARIIKPFNWSELEGFFGPYSTAWWKFIMEKLGCSSLPYWDMWSPIPNPDPDKYNMSYYEMANIQQLIRLELQEYNKNSAAGPLKHDDGEFAGQEVVVPAPW